MNLADLSSAMGGRLHPSDRGRTVEKVVIDSREADPGSLFFALRGEHRNGHQFVRDVLLSGACAVISEGPHTPGTVMVPDVEKALLSAGAWRRGFLTCPVIGVTGSSGKTTTRELIRSALQGSMAAGGTSGNLNNHLGLPMTLLNMPGEIDVAVLELGMNHAGELLMLGEVARPDISVVTNVGIAHMEFFETRDDVARAKSELLLTTKRGGLAVIPVNEPILRRAALDRDLEVVSIGDGGDLWLGGEEGSTTAEPFGVDLVLSVTGRYNLANSLFAIAVARALGIEPEVSVRRMSAYRGMAGRGLVVEVSGVRIMDESYNANPDSTSACLRTLAGMEPGRIAVLGDMRELGHIAHDMHTRVLELADSIGLRLLVLTGPLYAAASPCIEKTEFVLTGDWREALQVLRNRLEEGDTVLVKGSHSLEMNRIIASLEEES